MNNLETVLHDLQQAPPEHIEKVQQLLQDLNDTPAATEARVDWTMQFAGMLSHWSEEEWADFQAELQRTRAELFNRPIPEL